MNNTENPPLHRRAIQLANALDYHNQYDIDVIGTGIDVQAADELRRLYEQNKRYADRILEMTDTIDQLRTSNQELLGVLKEATAELECQNDPKGFVSMRQMQIMEKARAAIAKATCE